MTAYFPFWQKLAAVMRRVWPSTSFHRATFLSGIFQSRSFPSSEPLKKYLSSWKEEADFTINTARVRLKWGVAQLTLGWNAMAVTKSMCWKQHRHSRLDMCHNRTVLSMDEDSRKKFWINKQNWNKMRQKRQQLQLCSRYTTLSSGQESGGQRVITPHDWSATGVFTLHNSPSAGVAALFGLQCFVSRTHRGNDTGNARWVLCALLCYQKTKQNKKKLRSCCSCCLPSLAVALLTPLL